MFYLLSFEYRACDTVYKDVLCFCVQTRPYLVVQAAIEQKIKGKEITTPKESKTTTAASLMDALQQSLALMKGVDKKPTRKTATKKTAARKRA